MSVQDRLAIVIDDSELSHRQLEELTGISRTTIYRYSHKSVKKIPLDAVQAIAKATHTDATWIMGWELNNSYAPLDQRKKNVIDTIMSIQNEETLLKIQKVLDAIM